MIAFDTNLIVRYLTGDDEAQCKKVDRLIDLHAGEGAIFLSNIVLVETEWVLHTVYKFSRTEIVTAYETILSIAQFAFTDKETLRRAFQKYKRELRDFSDCLIGEEGKRMHARTYTFDKQLRKDDNFIVL